MNDETKLELLAIAAQLTEATLTSSAVSASHTPNQSDQVEAVLADCLKAVVSEFVKLDQA
jgi:hypothetical protein